MIPASLSSAGPLSLVREQLPKLMTGVAKLDVPRVAEVGDGVHWDEAH